MKPKQLISTALRVAALALVVLGPAATSATATEPCGDFGECKTLIEINASDGDIGFHFLFDGDELVQGRLQDPNGQVLFGDVAAGALAEQFMTETFLESAEPLCWHDPEAEEGEEILNIAQFLDRFVAGTYVFSARAGEDLESVSGETELTYELPAAPQDLDFIAGVISWSPGDDLGNCASAARLDVMVADGVLPIHPENVVVDHWEVVFEPDTEDGDPLGEDKFTVRVPGDIALTEVTVSAEYLASLPEDTLVKIEVGAIGGEDNATFAEEGDFCVNEVNGCEE